MGEEEAWILVRF